MSRFLCILVKTPCGEKAHGPIPADMAQSPTFRVVEHHRMGNGTNKRPHCRVVAGN